MNDDIKKYFADMAVEERLAEMHNDCVNNHAGDGEARGDWSIEIETLQLAMDEIERLNAQVARYKEFIESTLICWSNVTELGRNLIQQGNRIVSRYPSEWLTTHDAKVRDDALEEAGQQCQQLALSVENTDGYRNGAAWCQDRIMSLKGTK